MILGRYHVVLEKNHRFREKKVKAQTAQGTVLPHWCRTFVQGVWCFSRVVFFGHHVIRRVNFVFVTWVRTKNEGKVCFRSKKGNHENNYIPGGSYNTRASLGMSKEWLASTNANNIKQTIFLNFGNPYGHSVKKYEKRKASVKSFTMPT